MAPIVINLGNFSGVEPSYYFNTLIPAGNYIGGYFVRRNFTYNSNGSTTFVPNDTITVYSPAYQWNYGYKAPAPVYNGYLFYGGYALGSATSTFGAYAAVSDGTVTFNAPSDFCFAALTKEQLDIINYIAVNTGSYTSPNKIASNKAFNDNNAFNNTVELEQLILNNGSGTQPSLTVNLNNSNETQTFVPGLGGGYYTQSGWNLSGDLFLVLYPGGFGGDYLLGPDPSPIGNEQETTQPFVKFTGQQKTSSGNTLTLDFDFNFLGGGDGQIAVNPFNLYLDKSYDPFHPPTTLSATLKMVVDSTGAAGGQYAYCQLILPAFNYAGAGGPCGFIGSGYIAIDLFYCTIYTTPVTGHITLTLTYDEWKVINDTHEGSVGLVSTSQSNYQICNDRSLFDDTGESSHTLKYEARMMYGSTFSWNCTYTKNDNGRSIPSGSVLVGHYYTQPGASLIHQGPTGTPSVTCYDPNNFFPIGRVCDFQLTTRGYETCPIVESDFGLYGGTTKVSNVYFNQSSTPSIWNMQTFGDTHTSGGSYSSGPGFLTLVGGTLPIIGEGVGTGNPYNGLYIQGIASTAVVCTISGDALEGSNNSSWYGALLMSDQGLTSIVPGYEVNGGVLLPNTSGQLVNYAVDGSTYYINEEDPLYLLFEQNIANPFLTLVLYNRFWYDDYTNGLYHWNSVPPTGQKCDYFNLQLYLSGAVTRDNQGYLLDEIQWPVATITHDQALKVGDFTDATCWSGTNVTIVASNGIQLTCSDSNNNQAKWYGTGFDCKNYRYLTLTINCTAAFSGLTILFNDGIYNTALVQDLTNVPIRSWTTGPLSTGLNTVTLDLCNPVNGIAVDKTRTAWAYPGGTTYGVNYVATVEISGFTKSSVVTIQGMTLSRVGNTAGSVFPEATNRRITDGTYSSKFNVDLGQEFAPSDYSQLDGSPPPLINPYSSSNTGGAASSAFLNDEISFPYKRYSRIMQGHCDGKIVMDIPHAVQHAGYWSDFDKREFINFRLSINDVYNLVNSQTGLHMTAPTELTSYQFVNPYDLNYDQATYPNTRPANFTIYGKTTPAVFLTADAISSAPTGASINTPLDSVQLNCKPFYYKIIKYPGMDPGIMRTTGVSGHFNLSFVKRFKACPQALVTSATNTPVTSDVVGLIPLTTQDAAQYKSPDSNGYVQFSPVQEGYFWIGIGTSTTALDSGTSSGGNTITQFNDTAKSWGTNQWQGDILVITNGTGATAYNYIQSNTKTQLNLISIYAVNTDNTSEYLIISPTTNGDIVYCYDRSFPWRGLRDQGSPVGKYVCHFRDYNNRLAVVTVNNKGQLSYNYYSNSDEKGTFVNTIIDKSTKCSWPSFYLNGSVAAGTYLRGNTPIYTNSTDHGVTWTMAQVPIPTGWTNGFTQITSISRINYIVIIGYHVNTPSNSSDGATGAWQIVGVKNPDGTYNFGTNAPVKVGISGLVTLGTLTNRSDQVLELTWLDKNGTINLSRNNDLSYTNAGTWH